MSADKPDSDKKDVSRNEASREFLLGRTRGHGQKLRTEGQTGTPGVARQMAGDRVFVRQVRKATAGEHRFGLLVIKADSPSTEEIPEDSEGVGRRAKKIAGIVQEVCEREGGVWGAIAEDLLGCCLPGLDIEASLAISQEIQQQVGRLKNGTVSVGAAGYPLLDYDRSQVVDNALKALVHASFLGPGSVIAFDAVSLNISGDALYQAGDIAGAASEFEYGLRINPGEENLHNSLGVCYGVQGDQDKAIASFENALKIDPENVMALHNTGYSKSILNDTEGALAYFFKAYELDGSLFEVAFHTGKLLVGADRPEEGRPFLERAVEIKPDSGVGFYWLGECYHKMGQVEEAIQAYRFAVKRNPNDAAALSALGMLYDEKGENPEISMLFCQQGVDLEPENGLYRYRMGKVLMSQGKRKAALDMFESAQTLGYDAADKIAAVKKELEKREGEAYAHI